jgi:serine/threonine protein kinase
MRLRLVIRVDSARGPQEGVATGPKDSSAGARTCRARVDDETPGFRLYRMSALPIEGELFDGKYRIGPVLGVGGMAAVLAAKHLGLDEMVAIKVLLPECCDDPAVVERFVQEGKTASKIRSEHVVRMFDVGVASGGPYLVMEYLRGRDLAALLRERGPLPLALSVELLLQAFEAIGEGHALGIVHRDLKPANLFLTHRVDGSPFLKVLDFGISKMPRRPADGTGASPATLPSVVMGSPQYMAPEQMMSAAMAEPRSDIWSLGAIFYELLTGRIAFDGSTTTEVCSRVLQGAPLPLPQLRPDLPAGVGAVIARCLEKDCSRRYANVAELGRALAPFRGTSARPAAESALRALAPSAAPAAPGARRGSKSGPDTTRPTAAEILAIKPSRRRRVSGYVIASLLSCAALGVGLDFVRLRGRPLQTALPGNVAVAGAPGAAGEESLAPSQPSLRSALSATPASSPPTAPPPPALRRHGRGEGAATSPAAESAAGDAGDRDAVENPYALPPELDAK